MTKHAKGLFLAPFSLHLHQQGLVDLGQNTTVRHGGFDQVVQFLVSSDGQLQVSGRDSLKFQSLAAFPANSNTSAVKHHNTALK